MLLYVISSKLIGNGDEACAKMITSRFLRSLKGWWINILPPLNIIKYYMPKNSYKTRRNTINSYTRS